MGFFNRNRPATATLDRVQRSRVRRGVGALARPLTASGAKVGGDNGEKITLKTQKWQTEAWDYYDLVGELWYAANFYGGCFSQVRLKVGLRQPDGSVSDAFGDEIADDDTGELTGIREALHPLAQEAADLLTSLRSRIGGQAVLMKLMGVNINVPGEFIVLGTDNAVGQREWEILSTEEIKEDATQKGPDGSPKYVRVDDDNPQGKPLPDKHFLCRVWNPHPRKSKRADSAIRAQLEILEELLLLTRAVKSTTTSRLAGPGFLAYDSRIDYSDDEEAPEDGEKGDKFAADVITAATTAISDRASAAAVVPFIFAVEPPDGMSIKDMFHREDYRSNFDGYPSIALREEAVKRFAQGIDLPVEIITGQGGANHWGSWFIDESMFKQHFEPKLLVVCDGLTTGFLHPLLKANGGRTDADVWDLVVWYDASELVVHPNRGADATVGYGLELVAGRVWRRENGFNEEDAPDDDELQWRAERRQTMAPQPAPNDGPEQGADEVQPGAPEQDAAALLAQRLACAAEVAIERALDRAGARIRSKANGHQHVHAAIAGAPNSEVASLLGRDEVGRLMGDASVLVRPGEFDAFARVASAWAAQMGMTAPGIFGVEAARAVERLTGERLFRRFDVTPELFATLTASDFELAGV